MTDLQLKRLFEQRDRAERQVKMIDARISTARREYAERHGLLAFPSNDAMRKAVSNG